jgi:hypothetical protein
MLDEYRNFPMILLLNCVT